MKIKDFIDKITDNWPVKAACVLLAICIYIFYTLSMQDSKSFTVPLKIHANSGIVAAGAYPSTIKISLKGKTEDIASIKKDDFSAYLDLDFLSKDGTYRLPVLVDLPQQAMLLDTLEVTVSPQEVNLRVEEKITSFVPVKPLINGEPAHGYEIKSIVVKPDTIELTGPRSMVENCTRLQTKAVSVKNATVSLEQEVSPESPGAYLKLDSRQKLTVTVEIVPVGAEKEFKIASVGFVSLKNSLEVYPKNISGTIQLKGNLVDLEGFSPATQTLYVNCESIEEPGTYELPVKCQVSDKFEVKGFSPAKITVDVRNVAVIDELEEKIGDKDILASETEHIELEHTADTTDGQ